MSITFVQISFLLRMNRQICFILLSLYLIGCKSKQERATEEMPPVVASLAKTTFLPGDQLSIRLSEPLSRVTIRLDSAIVPIGQQSDTAISVQVTAPKIGLHQLVVQGVTQAKRNVSDTLSIELWSDIVPQPIVYSVLKTYPHQENSFTQGLEFYKGALYEGTGLNSQSKLLQVDLLTGSAIKSVPLADQYFGEGITVVNDKIYQLTWTSGVCFRYKMDFSLDKTFNYHTQGWGLTHRDTTLILSDGSNKLYFLNPNFQQKDEVSVYDNKGPVMNLNELEYANGYVFANVWQTNRIVQIDPTSGKVVGEMNMDGILPPINTQENVLNGIAYQPNENAFYVTGKRWPTMTKIQLKLAAKRTLAIR